MNDGVASSAYHLANSWMTWSDREGDRGRDLEGLCPGSDYFGRMKKGLEATKPLPKPLTKAPAYYSAQPKLNRHYLPTARSCIENGRCDGAVKRTSLSSRKPTRLIVVISG